MGYQGKERKGRICKKCKEDHVKNNALAYYKTSTEKSITMRTTIIQGTVKLLWQVEEGGWMDLDTAFRH